MPKSKTGLSAAFTIGEQPILNVPDVPKPEPQPLGTPKPHSRDHRANRQAFTVWLDRDLVARLRALSRDRVVANGRAGNTIEALVTEGIEAILNRHA